ncbi:four-carbon acid sugar kinase family protein [Kineococcus sp. TBRC 1896]|uniref:Four-carbon acid sugar kinase family protein n=1 Tax=Kineococcus mangrovi TaxID=1660183 RepID=A0ABV4I600_9ACTN
MTAPPTPRAPTRAALQHVLADDLSGAAEVAGALLARGRDCRVVLAGPDGAPAAPSGDGTTVVDTDHRASAPPSARSAVRAATADPDGPALVVVKLDSLWRGNVAATVEGLRDNGFQVVLAGALPSLGRSVRDGAPFVHDVPLADTALWALEPRPAPRTVADLLDGHVTAVPLHALRTGWTLQGQELCVLDGETGSDLRAAAAAAAGAVSRGRRVALVGSAALVAAVADTTPAPSRRAPAPVPAAGHRPVVLAVGSGSAAAVAQTAHLRAAAVVDEHTHLLTVDASGAGPGEAVADLARRVGRTHATADLVLTGGQTARAVLDHLGVRWLRPVTQPDHGVVVSLADDGRLVATKPGSFGQDPTLTDLVRLLRALRSGVPVRAPQEIP